MGILFAIIMGAVVIGIVIYSTLSNKNNEESTECLETKIAGINYQKGMSKYVGFFKGNIIPEPDNPFDKNALKVVHLDGKHLGYVPSEDIKEVTDLIKGDYQYPCVGKISKHYDEDEHRTFYSAELQIPYPGQKYITDIKDLHPEIYSKNLPPSSQKNTQQSSL